MVQKSDKRGVHSGNTLRASNSRFNRRYSRTSGLLRQTYNNTKKSNETLLDELNINSDNVLYSLNKKGRWEVPDLLKESILAGNYKNIDSNIKLFVSHSLRKTSHTVGFYSSKGQTKKVESKKKYMNGQSICNRNMKGNEKAVQVEVFYPCPKTSSVVHNPKFVDHNIDKPDNGRARTSSAQRQRQRLTLDQYFRHIIDDESYDLDDENEDEVIDEELSEYIYSNVQRESENSTELLEDIMVHAALMQSLCQKQSVKYDVKQVETKDRKVYEQSDDENTEADVPTNTFAEHVPSARPSMDPVYVVLPRKELERKSLEECYSDRYTECPCFPRKFIIDVTDRMYQRVKKSKSLQRDSFGELDLTSCVTFTQDDFDVNNSESNSVYKVCLNIGNNVTNFRILTLYDYFEGDLEDVLEQSVKFLEMVSTDDLLEKEKTLINSDVHLKFENLNKSQNVSKSVVSINRNSLYYEIFTQSNNPDNLDDFEVVPSEYCGICFDEFIGKAGTALYTCGHWFCDDCWANHCRSRMDNGTTMILCPEHGCEKTVDDKVLLTWVNVYEVLNFKRRIHEAKLEGNDNCKWCPNSNCKRLFQVGCSDRVRDIACLCGRQVCFQCLQPPHWPVSCEDAPGYWKKLKMRGDDIVHTETFVSVAGKSCPKCKRFIEKLGGCFTMTCVCGAFFCWGCLMTYPGHVWSDRCNQSKNGDLKGTTGLDVREMDEYNITKSCHQAGYKIAVNHRKARHPLKLKKLKSGARHINLKCKNLARRKGLLYFTMFKSHAQDSPNVNVEDIIKSLLMNSISIYTEIHHISEYCYVLLGKLSKAEKRGQFRSKIHELCYYADSIYSTLTESSTIEDFRPLLLRLLHIQQKIPSVTTSIVKYIQRIQN